MDDKDFAEMVDIVNSCPPDAQITGTDVYSGRVNKSKIIVNNKLLPGIGKFIGISIEAAQRAQQMMMQRQFGDDFDIDEFDM